MGSEPEWENENWEPPFDVALVELSPRLEERKHSRFLRIDRRRADYFADVEDISALLNLADFPTQRQDAVQQVDEAALLWPSVLPPEKQQTRLISFVEQPALVWSLANSLLAHITSLPTLPVLPALDVAASGELSLHISLRCVKRRSLARLVRSGLRAFRSVFPSSSSR